MACTRGALCDASACVCPPGASMRRPLRRHDDVPHELRRLRHDCGASECVSSACVCADNAMMCGDTCARTMNDPMSCGACGTTCATARKCAKSSDARRRRRVLSHQRATHQQARAPRGRTARHGRHGGDRQLHRRGPRPAHHHRLHPQREQPPSRHPAFSSHQERHPDPHHPARAGVQRAVFRGRDGDGGDLPQGAARRGAQRPSRGACSCTGARRQASPRAALLARREKAARASPAYASSTRTPRRGRPRGRWSRVTSSSEPRSRAPAT